MADNTTTICANGELQPGDLVLSSLYNDYASLVGTVLSIEKAGTPEHDTENTGDDIHVNFKDAAYSGRRISEIEQMLDGMYGHPTPTPGVLASIDFDDVIMAPEMLIRITGIEREALNKILDSRENAESYYAEVLAGQRTTEKLFSPLNFFIRDKAGTAEGWYNETDYWRDRRRGRYPDLLSQ